MNIEFEELTPADLESLEKRGYSVDPKTRAVRRLVNDPTDAEAKFMVPINTNDQDLIDDMNKRITPRRVMFRHGANDDYILDHHPSGKPQMGRNPDDKRFNEAGKDEDYIIATPEGKVTLVSSTAHLQALYENQGVYWPYLK